VSRVVRVVFDIFFYECGCQEVQCQECAGVTSTLFAKPRH